MPEQSTIDLASETLSGDLRDVLLTHIRSMETPWSKMSERLQNDKIYAMEKAATDIVRRAVHMIAADQRDVIEVNVAKFTVADKIKMEVIGNVTTPNIEQLADNRGRAAMLIFVSPADYFGQREAAKGEPDQPDLPIDGEDGETDDDADAGELPDPGSAPVAEAAE